MSSSRAAPSDDKHWLLKRPADILTSHENLKNIKPNTFKTLTISIFFVVDDTVCLLRQRLAGAASSYGAPTVFTETIRRSTDRKEVLRDLIIDFLEYPIFHGFTVDVQFTDFISVSPILLSQGARTDLPIAIILTLDANRPPKGEFKIRRLDLTHTTYAAASPLFAMPALLEMKNAGQLRVPGLTSKEITDIFSRLSLTRPISHKVSEDWVRRYCLNTVSAILAVKNAEDPGLLTEGFVAVNQHFHSEGTYIFTEEAPLGGRDVANFLWHEGKDFTVTAYFTDCGKKVWLKEAFYDPSMEMYAMIKNGRLNVVEWIEPEKETEYVASARRRIKWHKKMEVWRTKYVDGKLDPDDSSSDEDAPKKKVEKKEKIEGVNNKDEGEDHEDEGEASDASEDAGLSTEGAGL